MKGASEFVVKNFSGTPHGVTGGLKLLHDGSAFGQCLTPVTGVLVDATRAGAQAGKRGNTRRIAGGGDTVGTGERHPALGQALDIWGLDGRLGIEQRDAVVHVVNDDEQHVRLGLLGQCRSACEGQKEQCPQNHGCFFFC